MYLDITLYQDRSQNFQRDLLVLAKTINFDLLGFLN